MPKMSTPMYTQATAPTTGEPTMKVPFFLSEDFDTLNALASFADVPHSPDFQPDSPSTDQQEPATTELQAKDVEDIFFSLGSDATEPVVIDIVKPMKQEAVESIAANMDATMAFPFDVTTAASPAEDVKLLAPHVVPTATAQDLHHLSGDEDVATESEGHSSGVQTPEFSAADSIRMQLFGGAAPAPASTLASGAAAFSLQDVSTMQQMLSPIVPPAMPQVTPAELVAFPMAAPHFTAPVIPGFSSLAPKLSSLPVQRPPNQFEVAQQEKKMKRQERNKESAKNSRKRRKLHVESLETTLQRVEKELQDARAENEELKAKLQQQQPMQATPAPSTTPNPSVSAELAELRSMVTQLKAERVMQNEQMTFLKSMIQK
eukprot:GFYU01000388.1.p1 GENE.GFYU01000388.1~~GFYU01000388.1.p1  ORF type:complete len:375 (+),score=95.45 GFYU01000388.1:203-1327(+)